jgi:hypothetical protein
MTSKPSGALRKPLLNGYLEQLGVAILLHQGTAGALSE